MLVANWMTRNIITADKYDSVEVAKNLLKQHSFSLLPVMEKEVLCGIISGGDLYRETNSLAAQKDGPELKDTVSPKTVGQVMTPNVITVPPDFTVEETIELLIKNGIHGAPVINDNKDLIGVITKTDLLKAVVDLTGVSRRGIQYAFEVEDRPGSIKELSDTIRSHGGRIASIMTSCEGASDGYRKAYFRMYGIDRFRLNDLNEALKEIATLIYVVDHLEIRKVENTNNYL
jgi:acetoin utilization protein AcuB